MNRIGTSVVKDSKTGDVFIKLVNCLPEDVKMSVDLNSIYELEAVSESKGKTVPASAYALNADYSVLTGNFAEGGQKPSHGSVNVNKNAEGFVLDYTMPKYSFTVIKLVKRK